MRLSFWQKHWITTLYAITATTISLIVHLVYHCGIHG